MKMNLIVWFVFIPLEQKANLNHVKSLQNKEFIWYHKSVKALFIIYADFSSVILKIRRCENDTEN